MSSFSIGRVFTLNLRGASVALVLGMWGGLAPALAQVPALQSMIILQDTENGNLESHRFDGSRVFSIVEEPFGAYANGAPNYWDAQTFDVSRAAGTFIYDLDHGAPTRSPWKVTATAEGDRLDFTVSGKTSRSMAYSIRAPEHVRDEFGNPIFHDYRGTTQYSLNMDFSKAFPDHQVLGRTGIAGKITQVTLTLSYQAQVAAAVNPEQLYSREGAASFWIYDQTLAGDAEAQGQNAGAFALYRSPESGGLSMRGAPASEILYGANGTPVAEFGLLRFDLTGGGYRDDAVTEASLNVSGSFTSTYEMANSQSEFIFTGAANTFFQNYENWSQRMSPGVTDTLQFTHSDAKTVTFVWAGSGGAEENRSLRITGGGTTTVELDPITSGLGFSQFTGWRLGRNFADIDAPALVIESGKLSVREGIFEIVGDAILAASPGDTASFEISARSKVRFVNREREITPTLSEFVSSELKVGAQGRGNLTIKTGGQLVADSVTVGIATTATGKVDVSGTGSQLTAASMVIGQLGNGEMTVQQGGKVTLGTFAVAGGAGSQGKITVQDAGSELVMETGSLVGGEGGGRGRIEVLNGGKLTGGTDAGIAVILGIGGGNPAQPSTVLVSGSGSSLSNIGAIVRAGGLLQVRDGASWVSGGGANRLLVSGGETIFQNTGTVNLESIEVNKAFDNSGGPNQGALIATGRLNVLSGAVVNVANSLLIGAGAQVNVNGTGARIEGIDNGRIYGSLNVSNGGEVLAGPLGRIIVENGGVISGSGGVIAFQPKTDASGDFIPYVQVQAGGSIRPGNSPGTLTIHGDVVFEAGSTLQLEIGGMAPGSLYDQLVVTGNATFAVGSLVEFAFTNGFAPTAGQRFEFFEVAGTFSFSGESTFFSVSGLEEGWLYETSLIEGGFLLTSLSNGITTTTVSAIPEPSTWAFITGSLTLALVVWRRRRAGGI
ncbi:hypothetical protein [Oleiharenicola lentus]|uniref:hypothetical protein n=1 Tax=Oleiharenicola lentus TaxID=2508720 RepID=UPI003F6771D0